MKLVEQSFSNRFDKLYTLSGKTIRSIVQETVPYLRRLLRFIALPYYFFFEIRWEICKREKVHVLADLLYIFFRFKYYPDNYYLCRFWEKNKGEWKFYYGSLYDPYQRRIFQKKIYKKENLVLFDNKSVCYDLCNVAGFPLPKQYGMIHPDENYIQKIKNFVESSVTGKVIIKPFDGMGGRGITVSYLMDGEVVVKRKNSICKLSEFALNHPAVVQEYLKQHPLLSQFSSSTNTIRMATLLKEDRSDVVLIGAFIRFGVGSSDVDNLSSGGVAAGVNVESGKIHDHAIDFKGEVHFKHPTSGNPFKGFVVPNWNEVVTLSKSVQNYFHYHRLLGLDIAITDTGPVIIEINAVQDMVAMEMTYGPILKRREVWSQFHRYGLLVNNLSRRLYKA